MNESSIDSAVERLLPTTTKKKDWKRTIGKFAGNEFMQRVQEEGARIREENREEGRRKPETNESP